MGQLCCCSDDDGVGKMVLRDPPSPPEGMTWADVVAKIKSSSPTEGEVTGAIIAIHANGQVIASDGFDPTPAEIRKMRDNFLVGEDDLEMDKKAIVGRTATSNSEDVTGGTTQADVSAASIIFEGKKYRYRSSMSDQFAAVGHSVGEGGGHGALFFQSIEYAFDVDNGDDEEEEYERSSEKILVGAVGPGGADASVSSAVASVVSFLEYEC